MRIQLDNGFIEYREGTGGNIEITQIRAYEKGRGTGRELIRRLIEESKPYYSIYAFVLASRLDARRFYASCGLNEMPIGRGLYKNDGAIIMTANHEDIRKALGVLPPAVTK